MAGQPFTINVPQQTLDDLRERLEQTRWPDEVAGAGWDYGVDLGYLKELVAYWRDGFDWRAQEQALNRLAHVRIEIDGAGLHFVHERGQGPNSMPLLLIHGWPDSIVRFAKLIPLLTDPAAHGGDAADSFDVVVPSIPGYGFSDRPAERGVDEARVADRFARLMTAELGYERYGVHGGDIGSGIGELMARAVPQSLLGLHLLDVPYWHVFTPPADPSAAEQAYFAAIGEWQQQEGAYAMVQASKPQTLAYGLNDSPAGLAAWVVEKFRAWSDCDGDIERAFSKDELLTNLTIYWATETAGSAARIYFEAPQDPGAGGEIGRVEVPTGFASFPKDIVPAPREWAERFFPVQRWTPMPRGGHFAALEEPDLLAEEIRAFFRPLR